jgi:hypothetical protein
VKFVKSLMGIPNSMAADDASVCRTLNVYHDRPAGEPGQLKNGTAGM